MSTRKRGTSRVKSATRHTRMEVTADGAGIVLHAGAALLRELADESGLPACWTQALLGTYEGQPVHLPGRVLTDLGLFTDEGVVGVVVVSLAGSGSRSFQDGSSEASI